MNKKPKRKGSVSRQNGTKINKNYYSQDVEFFGTGHQGTHRTKC